MEVRQPASQWVGNSIVVGDHSDYVIRTVGGGGGGSGMQTWVGGLE